MSRRAPTDVQGKEQKKTAEVQRGSENDPSATTRELQHQIPRQSDLYTPILFPTWAPDLTRVSAQESSPISLAIA